MTENKNNRFYVYEWFNKDSGEVFYVGKGSGSRWKTKSGRNQYFKHYISKYECGVRKVKSNITESEAFNLEVEAIKEYRNKGECKCNLASGGEGSSWKDSPDTIYVMRRYLMLALNRSKLIYQSEKINPKTLEAYIHINSHAYCDEQLDKLLEIFDDFKIKSNQDIFDMSEHDVESAYSDLDFYVNSYGDNMRAGSEFLSYLDDDE